MGGGVERGGGMGVTPAYQLNTHQGIQYPLGGAAHAARRAGSETLPPSAYAQPQPARRAADAGNTII